MKACICPSCKLNKIAKNNARQLPNSGRYTPSSTSNKELHGCTYFVELSLWLEKFYSYVSTDRRVRLRLGVRQGPPEEQDIGQEGRDRWVAPDGQKNLSAAVLQTRFRPHVLPEAQCPDHNTIQVRILQNVCVIPNYSVTRLGYFCNTTIAQIFSNFRGLLKRKFFEVKLLLLIWATLGRIGLLFSSIWSHCS